MLWEIWYSVKCAGGLHSLNSFQDEVPSSSQGCSKMPSSASHVKLFDDDSSGDEEPGLIKIANRHEGKKGNAHFAV